MDTKQSLIEQLEQATRDGFVFKIRELVELARQQYPNEPFVDFYQAEAHLQAWEYPQALEILNHLHHQSPDNAQYAARYAVALLKNQKITEGVQLFETLLEANQDDADLYFNFGKEVTNICWQGEEVRKAINALSHVLVLQPDRSAALLERATAYQNIGQYPQALQDLNAYIAANPHAALGYQRHISLNTFLKNDEAVRQDYHTLIQMNPNDVSHLYNYAQYLFKQGDYPEAVKQLNQQIKQEQENNWTPTGAIALRGEVLYAMGELEKALADFNFVLAEDHSNSTTQKMRAQTYRDLNQDEAFLKDVEDALSKGSFYKQEFLTLRADYYLKKGLLDLAQADYNQFLTDPDLSFHKKDGYFGLGLVAHAKNDLAHAYENWKLAQDNYHEDAESYIEQYCSEYLAQQAKAKNDIILQEFAHAPANNAKSPILSKIFGKTWRMDIDKTQDASPAIKKLPQGIVAFLIEALRNIAITITPDTLTLANPAHGDIVAHYRIESENAKEVHIYGQPLGNQEPRRLALGLDGDYLLVQGLMDNTQQPTSGDPIFLYFAVGKAETTTPETQEEAEARMKKLAENFIGDLLSTVVEGLESIGDMLSPKGEAASDDIPPQNDDK